MRGTDDPRLGRRRVLRGVLAVGVGSALAGCTGGDGADGSDGTAGDGADTADTAGTTGGSGNGGDGGTATSTAADGANTSSETAGSTAAGDTRFAGWFDDVENYDGVVDRTGQGQVTVEVGAQGNGGYYAFAPPAIRVSPGTTVVWRWTGRGGAHNVVAEDGTFESRLTSEQGFTFERTFESGGTTKYVCRPHESLGMKGAVAVE